MPVCGRETTRKLTFTPCHELAYRAPGHIGIFRSGLARASKQYRAWTNPVATWWQLHWSWINTSPCGQRRFGRLVTKLRSETPIKRQGEENPEKCGRGRSEAPSIFCYPSLLGAVCQRAFPTAARGNVQEVLPPETRIGINATRHIAESIPLRVAIQHHRVTAKGHLPPQVVADVMFIEPSGNVIPVVGFHC